MWWSIFPKTHKSFNIKWLSLSSTSPKFEIWSDKAHPRYSEPENLKYLKYLILSLSSLYLTKNLKISNNPISSEQPHPTCIPTYPQLQKTQKPFDPGFSILSGSIKERNIRIKSEGLELMMINVPNWPWAPPATPKWLLHHIILPRFLSWGSWILRFQTPNS